MKEEKMETRKKVRETFDAYQERTKNDPQMKIGLIGKGDAVGKHTQKILDEIARDGRVPSGPRGVRKKQYSTIKIDNNKMPDKRYEAKETVGNIDYSKIEMSNGDHIIYGIDEIGSICGLYGKDSEIYNAMAEGKVVSGLIEESMREHQQIGQIEIAKREESLLNRCLQREKEKGLSL